MKKEKCPICNKNVVFSIVNEGEKQCPECNITFFTIIG